ncbi:hypothetical protein BU26DRAFT_594219 [Trematosphaeria pertusa]|uniref:Gfd2/YDR514C-like C-terminal domain-containing protein n=1 Tax=Trematosphaeria pertusa TaxID=390896 RepID=A0A6A6III1_9PLEO|nr:uncharacterized protein BU26DRAFT_594219 [Trematosphaeria pertusa]KAF2250384.1 hypothetical protein BU26DRAFT_594219 [Trematosphaeria pertusa]
MDSIAPFVGTDPLKAELHAFLSTHTDTNVLRHFLGTSFPFAPLHLNDCAIVCLNLEWWQKEPHPTTEIGIAELHPTGIFPTVHAENILREIRVAHARVMENAHLLNHFHGSGNPDVFHFGTTKFVCIEEARDVLVNTFVRPSADGTMLQPIIFLAHDADKKFEHVKEKFGLDLLALGTIVKVIDTQTLARQAGILGPKGPSISLPHLVEHFNITPQNLHTAGNDAGYTMITAILSSLKNDLYGHRPLAEAFGRPPAVVGSRNIQCVVEDLMKTNKSLPPPPWGYRLYCTRCDRINHVRSQCFAKVWCEICAHSGNAKLEKACRTHMTERCVYNYQPLPRASPEPKKEELRDEVERSVPESD